MISMMHSQYIPFSTHFQCVKQENVHSLQLQTLPANIVDMPMS